MTTPGRGGDDDGRAVSNLERGAGDPGDRPEDAEEAAGREPVRGEARAPVSSRRWRPLSYRSSCPTSSRPVPAGCRRPSRSRSSSR